MNSATLKTIRESLGLTVGWLANQAQVQERTVRYWESGRNEVPDDVAEMMLKLEVLSADMVLRATHQIDAIVKKNGKPSSAIVLVRYQSDKDLWKYRPDLKMLPATFHAGVLARVRAALSEDDVDVEMQWLDADAYQIWLKDTKQKDSETLRTQFVMLD